MTCFVCMDETLAPKAECLCTTRYVHTDCLKKLIERTGQLHCCVCLAPYDVVIKKRKQFVWTQEGFVCILIIFANLLVYVISYVSIPTILLLSRMQQILLSCLLGILLLVVTIVTLWWIYTVCSNRLPLIKMKEKIQVLSIPDRIST